MLDRIAQTPKHLVRVVLGVSLLVSAVAGFVFRPEYLDGGKVIFDSLNRAAPTTAFYAIHERTLYDILHMWVPVLKYFPNSDISFFIQQILLNLWVAILPLMIFAISFWVLFKQRREYLIPYVIYILSIALFFASGLHAITFSETLAMSLLFYLLSDRASEKIHPITYSFLMLFSSTLVTGYELFLPIYFLGILKFVFEVLYRNRSARSIHSMLFFLFSGFSLVFLVNRFSGMPFFLFSTPHAISAMANPFNQGAIWIATIGLGFFLLPKIPQHGRKFLWHLNFSFFVLFSWMYADGDFEMINKFSRFPRAFILFLFSTPIFFLSENYLKSNQKHILRWSLASFLLIVASDLQNSYRFYQYKSKQIVNLEELPFGCTQVPESVELAFESSILSQHSFTPPKITINCKTWNQYDSMPSNYCAPFRNKKNELTLECLDRKNIQLQRISIQHLLGPIAE